MMNVELELSRLSIRELYCSKMYSSPKSFLRTVFNHSLGIIRYHLHFDLTGCLRGPVGSSLARFSSHWDGDLLVIIYHLSTSVK